MVKKPEETHIAICGGGIGGLSVALCLQKLGFKITIFERAPEISELGVGINLLPHATKILYDLGLGKDMDEIGVHTDEIRYYSHKGDLIYKEPRGKAAGFETPQYSIHRGKLQLGLYNAVKQRIGVDSVKLDHELVEFVQDDSSVTLQFKSFSGKMYPKVKVDLMIGVDGIKSTTRNVLYPGEKAKFTGWVIWRGAVETDKYLTGKTMLVMGKGENLAVLYPIDNQLASSGSKKSLINWGILKRINRPSDENWQKKGDKNDILHFFNDWKYHPEMDKSFDVQKIINQTEVVLEYAMHDRDPIEQWTFGRVTLAGDAAHPLLPFGSQGAGQAILDAEALYKALAPHVKTGNYVQGLKDYEKLRVQIAKQVVENNRMMGPTRILKVFEENPNVSQEELKKISQGYAVLAGVKSKL